MKTRISSLALRVSLGLCLIGGTATADEFSVEAVSISGMRAKALYEHFDKSYFLRPSAEGQYTTVLKADSIRCVLNTLTAPVPTCSLVQDGQAVTAQPAVGSSAASSLFELLSEEGAAHPLEQDPAVIVASATKVSCSYYAHGPIFYTCTFMPAQGVAMNTPTPFNAKVTGVFAQRALVAIAQAGLANQPDHQYQDIRRADQIKCTAAMEDYRWGTTLTCTIYAGDKTFMPGASANSSLYRLIAESGGASFDQAAHAYVANATQVECANLYTHGDTPTSCTFTLASRHQVITHFAVAEFVAPAQQPSFLEAIKASGARSSNYNENSAYVTLGAIDCINPSTTSNQVTWLQCSSKIDRKSAATPTTAWNNYVLFSAVVDAGGNRLDPATLSVTQASGQDLWCYVENGTVNGCRVSTFHTMPL